MVRELEEKELPFLFDSLIYPLAKGKHLRFSVRVNRYSIKISKCEWIITNAGYEARKKGDLRGESTSVPSITRDNFDYYYKEEHTKYYGDHFVQARLTTNTNRVIYTEKIRDQFIVLTHNFSVVIYHCHKREF